MVPSDFDEKDQAKYAFCNTPSVINENPHISVNECKALIDLYLENDGDNWKDKSGWSNANQLDRTRYVKSICTWYGVSCDEGKLVGIDLSGNGLK